ncbi:MAG TPA: glycosyltransferase [Hyphomonadaceae bacterium]|jgi:glycosyltransferase involved in cell wall biosynthesis
MTATRATHLTRERSTSLIDTGYPRGWRVKVVSCRPAWIRTSNRFTTLFSQAVQQAGWEVREFAWRPSAVFGSKVILLHWPDELFASKGVVANVKAAFKLATFRLAKHICGAKLVWVVHETAPHDRGRKAPWVTNAFLRSLDGAIFLSQASKVASEADLPALKNIPALITRHGHYRIDMEKPPQPRRRPGKALNLIYFGQIRPYKNLNGLIAAARRFQPGDVQVKIMGWSKDPHFTRTLQEEAKSAPAVTLDIRDELVPQPELEAALDDSDGVVLPYRNILNSGAALFALSRNRPVLAPRLGTLPELQDEIGQDWVDLYDGDIGGEDLNEFATRLRRSNADTADLSRYEWGPIGESIGGFFDELSTKAGKARARQHQPEDMWR